MKATQHSGVSKPEAKYKRPSEISSKVGKKFWSFKTFDFLWFKYDAREVPGIMFLTILSFPKY